MATKNNYSNGPMIGGVIVLILGLTFLVQSYLHIDILDKIWPLFLVGAGVVMIINARHNK